MPDRILRAAILDSDGVNTLTWGGEVFYRRLMSVADDYGRADARLQVLRSSLYPLKISQVSEPDIAKWLTECVNAGLIRFYQVEGRDYIEIFKFKQRLRSMRSKFPAPIDDGGHPPAVVSSPPPILKRNENDSENEGEAKAPPYFEKSETISEDRFETYEDWTNLILNESDPVFTPMIINAKTEYSKEAIEDHLSLVARYNWKFISQQKFRVSVVKHIKEFIEKQKKFSGGKFQPPPTSTTYVPSFKKPETIGEVNTPLETIESEEEKKAEARKEMEILIDNDFTRFCEDENCQIRFAGLEFDFLHKQGKIRVNKEQREEYERQAVEIRIIRLGGVVDPIRNPLKEVRDSASKLLLDQYKKGRIPDGDLLSMKAVAKDLALRDYFRQLKQQEEQIQLKEMVH